MKTFLYHLLFIFLLPFGPMLLGQGTNGTIRLFVSPPNAFMKIDSVLVDFSGKNQPILLVGNPGMRVIQTWAPGFLVATDTVYITEGKTVDFLKGLKKLDPAFKQYREDMTRYNTQRAIDILGIAAGVTAISVSIVALDFTKSKANDYYEQALLAREDYANAITQVRIQQAKDAYYGNIERYKAEVSKKNTRNLIFGPLIALSVGATAWQVRRFIRSKAHRPAPYDMRNPLAFEPFMEADAGGNSTAQVGIRIKF